MPEGLEVVVEQTDNLTTFQLPVSFSAVHRAFSADRSVEPETEHDTTLDSFCVVDDRDLVQEVRVPDRGSITFLDWGWLQTSRHRRRPRSRTSWSTSFATVWRRTPVIEGLPGRPTSVCET